MGPIARRDWKREWRGGHSLSEVLYVLWKHRLLVVAVLVLVLAATLLSMLHRPYYTGEATVVIQPSGESDTSIGDILAVVVTDEMLRDAKREAVWGGGLREFKDRLDTQTSVMRDGGYRLRIRFFASEPEKAARAANAYATLFVQRGERLADGRLGGDTFAADANVERRAVPPGNWDRFLRPGLYVVVAVITGVFLGGLAALLFEERSRGWRDSHDVEMTLRVPVLGAIPNYSSIEEEC